MKTIATSAIILAPLTLAQSLCGQYSYDKSGKYDFNNNAYNEYYPGVSGSQCLNVKSVSGSGCSWNAQWQWSNSADGAPIAYPYSGITVNPKKISNIKSMPTTARWSYRTTDVDVDISYDLFTASDPSHSPDYGDFELMIWLGHYGGQEPLGSQITTATIEKIDWEVYYGTQVINGTTQKTYSFVAPSTKTSWTGDVINFWNYLAKHHHFPATKQYLLTFQFGTETFSGGPATFTVDHWDASIKS